jgi:hypothetical protein
MPLPSMASDPDQMLSGPGMSAPAPQQDAGSSPVSPQDQARGAVQVLGQLRQGSTEQLEAVATQFPTVSKDAKELQQMIDKGIQNLVKAIVRTVQTQEPAAPATVR